MIPSPFVNLILRITAFSTCYCPLRAFGRRPKTYRLDTEQNLLCSCMSGLVVMVMVEVMEPRRAREDCLWTEGDRVSFRAETGDMHRSDGKLAGFDFCSASDVISCYSLQRYTIVEQSQLQLSSTFTKKKNIFEKQERNTDRDTDRI